MVATRLVADNSTKRPMYLEAPPTVSGQNYPDSI
jgi:hypothetical protein